jgi:hypothetical protein
MICEEVHIYNATDKPVKSQMLIHNVMHRHIVPVAVSSRVTICLPLECELVLYSSKHLGYETGSPGEQRC